MNLYRKIAYLSKLIVGKYLLNGNWFIQWSGDYKAAGTTFQYTREGNKESVVSPGPLKEPLHVMVCCHGYASAVTANFISPPKK